jgi:AcrR family transcriptional regulator
MDRVLRFASQELESSGPVQFNLDRVIELSGVSRGSVYHHFGNRDGLIAAVEIEDFTRYMMSGVEYLREDILKMDSIETWLQEIQLMLLSDHAQQSRERRIRRISSIVAAQGNPTLLTALSQVQMEGTRHLAETLRMAVEKGIMNPTAPVLGIAYLFQSILVGRVLVDLEEDPDAEREWVRAASEALRHLIHGSVPQ